MLLQPFVENSIVHGIMNKNEKGKLKILLEKNNGSIHCVIQDDGIGREKALKNKSVKNSQKEGKALLITNERVKLLERLFNKSIQVKILDLFDKQNNPSGTKVGIDLSN